MKRCLLLAWLVLAFSGGLAAQLLYDPQPLQDVEKLVADVIGTALR